MSDNLPAEQLAPQRLATEFKRMWELPHRRKTLGRIIVHERQFENWWKFEVATHLWELAEELNVYVWIEADDRADVLLAPARATVPLRFDPEGSPRVPIELKTAGTFWKNPKKVYSEEGKKRLLHDMRDACERAASGANPFAVVALLVTHAGSSSDPAMSAFLQLPRDLASQTGLTSILDAPVVLGRNPGGHAVCAHQLMWVACAT